LQYGYADADLSAVDHHLGTGITWTGLIPARDDDAFGIGVTAAHLSQKTGAGFRMDYEVTTEMFYEYRFAGWVTLRAICST
jgi:carbohydrate-selective porin OprB